VPRRNSPVKLKGKSGGRKSTRRTSQIAGGKLSKNLQSLKVLGKVLARSTGVVDLHFHGAFGVDLMRAQNPELGDLAHYLGEHGIAAFCPTTLSTEPDDLAAAVARLGRWIRRSRTSPTFPKTSALPLGIHLEGPFINTACCGAHPPELIRPFDINELETLWNLSQETLKILTIAPETLSPSSLSHLAAWARERNISLSLGHSNATEEQALHAFNHGFRGITHAWNALPFHQRAPGPLAAAFRHPKSYVEIIIDQIHVAPSVIQWTEELQPAHRLCYVSDCAPAAETDGLVAMSFGPLKIRNRDGACRLENGALAGGGKLLTRAFSEWICQTAPAQTAAAVTSHLKKRLPSVTEAPLFALGIRKSELAGRTVDWVWDGEKISARPIA
jgi:N-acetylglucosamine-6-phosphate deacetylase